MHGSKKAKPFWAIIHGMDVAGITSMNYRTVVMCQQRWMVGCQTNLGNDQWIDENGVDEIRYCFQLRGNRLNPGNHPLVWGWTPSLSICPKLMEHTFCGQTQTVILCFLLGIISKQGSSWVWAQPMRDDVTTSSPIGWAHTQNDLCYITDIQFGFTAQVCTFHKTNYKTDTKI